MITFGLFSNYKVHEHKIWDVPQAQHPANVQQLSAAQFPAATDYVIMPEHPSVVNWETSDGMVDWCRWRQTAGGRTFVP